MEKIIRVLIACAFLSGLVSPAVAQVQPFEMQRQPFDEWLSEFAMEAARSGISAQTIQKALTGLTPDESVVELDQKQPESTITFEKYASNILSPQRIEKGRELYQENKSALSIIGARYGVPPQYIIALWGIESAYGTNGGNYEVIQSLATLAYEGRRAEFFRKELMEALHLLDEEKMDPSFLVGSWAGAMGQSQFMPSTFRRYAVDHDGDGKRDIWENEADIFASIASYLAAEGWKPNQGWGREVTMHWPISQEEMGLEMRHALAKWSQLGVRTMKRKPLPNVSLAASLIQPDGPEGRSFLVYDNFRALMRWNRSTYFATTVGLLADQIAAGQ